MGVLNIITTTLEKISRKVTSWSVTTLDTNYPSEKLVKDSLDLKADLTDLVSVYATCRNNTGSQINKGQIVYITGAVGQMPTIALAKADAEATSFNIGVANQDIPINTNVQNNVTINGLIETLDTSAYTEGLPIMLSAATAGLITSTPVTSPNFAVTIGFCLYSHAVNGKLIIFQGIPRATNTTLSNSNIIAPTSGAVKYNLDLKANGTGTANGTNTGDETLATLHTKINAASNYPTIADGDKIAVIDPTDSTVKTTLWSTVKSVLKTYFDGFYEPIFSKNTAFNKNFGTTTGTVADGLSLATFMAIPKVCMTTVGTMYNTYAAGTRWMGNFATSSAVMGTSNAALAQQPVTYSIVSTDYPTINGVTPKFRLRATIGVNNTAPAANISFGLFPLTTPASAGGVTVKSWTIGAEVVDSTITQNTPAANTQYELVSATFGLPANGLYAICITNSAQTATNSYMTNSATLETFY